MPLTGASNESNFLFALGKRTDIRVLGFQVTEAISTNFIVELTLACDQDVAFDDIIGQTACLTVLGHQTDRYWHGIIRDLSLTGTNERFLIYHATLVPALWVLTQEQDCRIFQGENTQQIVEKILKEAGLTSKEYAFNNQSPGTTREYCVQYRESDFNFISRLLEEDGIFFFFEHDQKDTTVVFGDGPSAYKPIEGDSKVTLSTSPGMVAEKEFIRGINFSRHVHSGKITLTDYNFEKPALDLTSEAKDKVFDNLEVYDYPGRFEDQSAGKKAANVRLQQSITYKDQAAGNSVCPRLAPGHTFTLKTTQKLPEFTKEYMLVSVTHIGEQPQALEELANPHAVNSYNNSFICIPSSVTFRPQGAAAKPVISGVQTAMVVGPSGEEIFTDKYGRIKVQFHWDRVGKNDDKSSCWIRVSQVFTGAGFGAMAVPRIGQEMIVGFVEGDPDRPIITGRVYHGNNPPPYTLPDDKTKTTFRSNSSIGGGGFNELRFEDKKGQEEIFIHAQKDWNTKVLNDRNTEIKANQSAKIGANNTIEVGKNQNTDIGADQLERTKGDKHITVAGDCAEKVDGTHSLTVGMNKQEKVSMNHALDAGMEIHLKAGMNVVIESGVTLTLKVGGNFININTAGVFIQGTMLGLNSGGAAGTGAGASPATPKLPTQAQAVTAPSAKNVKSSAASKSTTLSPQAKAVTEGAKSGKAFCEVCEKMKKNKKATPPQTKPSTGTSSSSSSTSSSSQTGSASGTSTSGSSSSSSGTGSNKSRKLGALSTQYETGGRGAMTVSSGVGDAGGVSYGSYQMTSKPNGGTVTGFVKSSDCPWGSEFAGLTAGTPDFTKKWKEVVTAHKQDFEEAEHAFIKRTHYDPLVEKIKRENNIDVTEHSDALNDVVWSTAVQHGKSTGIVGIAINKVSTPVSKSKDYDEELIKEIYAERGRKKADGTLVYFGKNSQQVQNGVTARFNSELPKALKELKDENF